MSRGSKMMAGGSIVAIPTMDEGTSPNASQGTTAHHEDEEYAHTTVLNRSPIMWHTKLMACLLSREKKAFQLQIQTLP
ncbi:hypothetical protein E2C01_092984 [Portunus trituberculatus]|uniref:Uncharacterized protein n=1 Tax=Portunus trituberculatus TaxID=210409 RepID=A0A5B7JLQ4_PORTR|nr:hypothetical protein [Portunus trituberculatus]